MIKVFAMVKAVLADEADAKTRITILYQNRTEADILLRDELVAMASLAGARIKLVLACSRADPSFMSLGPIQQVIRNIFYR